MTEPFSLWFLRFGLTARTPVAFPPVKAANVLRGALGSALRQLSCATDCPGFRGLPSRLCGAARSCAYARLFEPGDLEDVPSGLVDRPRPYVIRAGHLDGRTFEAGRSFSFDFHLFDTRPGANDLVSHLTSALTQVLRDGIGPSRGTAEVADLTREFMQIDLTPMASAQSRIAVEFRTPTELKSEGVIVERPEFAVLFARVRDRIATLRALYGSGLVAIDFVSLGERAEAIRLDKCSLRHVGAMRRSSRTGQSHPLGGFIGEAQYCGKFEEFLPWLRAAEWTGVGRQTVWGKGAIQVREL